MKLNLLFIFLSFQLYQLQAQISPLLKTKWHQGCGFNELMPPSSVLSNCNKDVTGCSGLAVAQLLKYWQFPSQGFGTISYTQSGASTPTEVKMDTVQFNWDRIGDTLDQAGKSNLALQKLVLNSAYVARSSFGANETPGVIDPINLINNLDFSFLMKFIAEPFPSEKTDSISQLIKTELNAERPVLLGVRRKSDGAGHAVILDGYKDGNPILFHFNWGWGVLSEGYYPLNEQITKKEGAFNPLYLIYNIKPKVPGIIEVQEDTVYNESFSDYHILANTFYFTSDRKWQITLNNSWLEFYETSATGEGSPSENFVMVYALPNINPNQRTGSITISNGVSSKKIVIVQYGNSPAGVDRSKILSSGKLDLYPNPSSGLLYVKSSELPNANRMLTISNVQGETVLAFPFTDMETKLQLTGLKPGMYFIQSQGKAQKFIIE